MSYYYPNRVVCKFFNGTPGSCRYGDNCNFSHDSNKTAFDRSRFKYISPNIISKVKEESATAVAKGVTDREAAKSEQSAPQNLGIKTNGNSLKQQIAPCEKQKENVYSQLSELDQSDRLNFEAKSFTLGNIPYVPPSIELA